MTSPTPAQNPERAPQGPGTGDPFPAISLPKPEAEPLPGMESLEDSRDVDTGREGVTALMHRPLELTPPELCRHFRMLDPQTLSVAQLLPALPQQFSCPGGRVTMRIMAERAAVEILAEGADDRQLPFQRNALAAVLHYDAAARVSGIELHTRGIFDYLTRSSFSLLLADSGFTAAYPEIFRMLQEQFVLEAPSDELRDRERLSYREIPVHELQHALSSHDQQAALRYIFELKQSKSQEVRRYAAACLEELCDQKTVSVGDFWCERDGFFREDLREDLIFIERTLRNDEYFVTGTFRQLFGRELSREDWLHSDVSARYFARGNNKQIYVVDWRLPQGESFQFAIATIRDAMMGAGDFNAEEINAASNLWQTLCYQGCSSIVKFGAATWHNDWRRRSICVDSGTSLKFQLIANNIMLVAREFVPNAQPLNAILRSSLPRAEKEQALETAARAYWQVYFRSRAADGRGCFLTTPRAEDVVIRRGAAGSLEARIVDLDTLEADVSADRAANYFFIYRYYPRALIERLYQELGASLPAAL